MRRTSDNESRAGAADGSEAGEPWRKNEVPAWRASAGPGLSLAAARRRFAHGPATGGGLDLRSEISDLRAPMPSGLSRSLAKILRPQAAYRWLLPQLAAITPQYIEMTLRGALAGSHVQAWELFDLMEDTSPRLMKNLNEVKRAVVGLDWQLFAWQEENRPPSAAAQARARLVGGALRGMRPDPAADENDFSGTIYDVLDAWGKGQSVLEVDWEARDTGGELGAIIAPRASYWVHPTCVSWDMQGRLGLRMELGKSQISDLKSQKGGLTPGVWQTTAMQPRPGMIQEFPAHKFLLAICKAKSGTALGGALLRPLAWWWCVANFAGEWLMNLTQVFGVPFRWVTYPTGAPQATIDNLCTMLEDMGTNTWAAFPSGTTLELKEPARGGGDSPQGDLLDRAEKQMDLLILGQTLTTDVSKQGGSRALGEVHAGVKEEVVRAAGEFSARVINTQLIPSILRLNYGNADEPPQFRPMPRALADARANAERDAILLAAGVRLPEAWFYQRHDVPLPREGEKTVGGQGRIEN